MNKKRYFVIVLIALVIGAVFYFYLTKFFLPAREENKIYTADDFPQALEKMDEEILRLTLEDLNSQYQDKKEDKQVYVSWINIGILKKRLGDYQGAEDAWQNAISYNPDQPLAFGNLADLYLFELKEIEKAEEYYKKVLTMSPNYYNYYIGLATLYRYEMTDKANLIENLMNDGARINPGERENYYMYLASYFAHGPENKGGNDIEKAKFYTQKTLEVDPNLKDQLPDL